LTAYDEVREWLEDTAVVSGAELWDVERALYQLSRRVPDSDNRTWRQYGADLLRLLDQT
jgi:hypothetical protein